MQCLFFAIRAKSQQQQQQKINSLINNKSILALIALSLFAKTLQMIISKYKLALNININDRQ